MKGFKTVFRSCLMLLFMSVVSQLTAQDSCTYRLRLYDRFGDGWDDSQLYIKLGSNAEQAFTHEGASALESDSIRLFNIKVKVGDTIVVRYEPQGTYQNEIKYALYNNAGETLVSAGINPTVGVSYRGSVKCIACGAPLDLTVASVRSFTTTINWNPSQIGVRPTYRIEWNETNFTPGKSLNAGTTTDTFAILPGLKEITKYFVYVRTTCSSATDTSKWVGPVSFTTDTATNVGISDIITPISRCDLGVDSVRVKIKNYAGGPISLIPFKYSVNGVNAPVAIPTDGFYTGVISKDSTATFAFKATSDFTAPGEYNIVAWTELEGDKNPKNDTFKLTVVRPRVISDLPYQQGFESGKDTWQVVDKLGKSTWELATPRYRYINSAGGGSKSWTTAADTSYRNGDTSYLVSPCFDFSSAGADPRINFSLNYFTERNFDGAWLESSIDGGTTWSKVGRRNSGINWYNDTLSRQSFDVWTGTDRIGWHVAQNILSGFRGQPQCRLRFAFRSDNNNNINFDGIGIDNIVVSSVVEVDMATDSIGKVDISDCGSPTDTAVLKIFNLSSTQESNYKLSFQVDNNTPVTETVVLAIPPGQSALYKFKTTFNSVLASGSHTLKAWVNHDDDDVRINDTVTTIFTISPAQKGNIVYNFDDGVPPQYWTADRATISKGRHGNLAANGFLFANIFSDTVDIDGEIIITPNAQLFDVVTSKFGAVRADDSLKYDYRFVGEDAPYVGYSLVNKDTLRVYAVVDCGSNWIEIDRVTATNHVVTDKYQTRSISLKQFAGKNVKIRFQVKSDISDFVGYFFDLDNVNFKSVCPTDFALSATVKRADRNQSNGQIVVKPTRGLAPFTYKWSNNATVDSIANLAVGEYTVTVADANGCTEVRTFKVDFVSSTFEPSSAISQFTLSPNPTTGDALLNVEFRKVLDARVDVMNVMGQLINTQYSRQTDNAQFELDLSNRPAGIYLIRITADNKTHTTRLVKQ